MSRPTRATLVELLDAAAHGALVEHCAALARATGIVSKARLLPALLSACADNHALERAFYAEKQNPPPRPSRSRPRTGHAYLDWSLARDEDDFEFYAEDYDAAYKPKSSNDGHNRVSQGGPPITPLHRLHLMLSLFYHHDLHATFSPALVCDEKTLKERETPRDRLVAILANSNEAFRLFYFTARHCDADYRLENCNGVLESLKKQRLSPEAQAKRRAWRREYMRQRRAAERTA